MAKKQLKVAIVHDWLYGGGAERVVLELHRMFPDAPIYTSYCSDEWREKLDGKVVTGWLQRFGGGRLRKFMTLGRIWWFTHLDFTSYDLVISSCGNGEAKSVRTPEGTKHISYIHAPTHYYWRHYEQYLREPGFGALNWLARLGLRMLIGPLRWWDRERASKRPDVMIANSTHTAAEIKEFYGRESVVVQPPIDVERFDVKAPKKKHGFITVGRQTSYKHNDIILEACNRLQLPLLVVGRGPEHENLERLAGPTVTLRTDVTDEELPHLIAAGTPLIAYGAGGALDYVIPGKTGEFFADQSSDALAAALEQFDAKAYDTRLIQQKASEFSPEAFQRKIRTVIAQQ
jgi:glycosyltransferase involved in cell wall biosynthesis